MNLFHSGNSKGSYSPEKMEKCGRSVTGIYDFSYAPFALGDIITWVMNLLVLCERKNADYVDIVILCSPEDLPNKLQPHINNYNYLSYLQKILPAFFLAKKIRTVLIVQEKKLIAQKISGLSLFSDRTWPSLWSHYKRQLNYSDHKKINKFFSQFGYLPTVSFSSDNAKQACEALLPVLDGKTPIMLNIRQRGNTNNPAALHRDGNIDSWLIFLDFCRVNETEFVFLLVGDTTEFDKNILKLTNILVPRVFGLGLEHELALITAGVPFIGNSSGFSACATFSKTPYAIMKFEHAAAKYIDLPVGSERYPFAHDNQRLYWDDDNFDLILAAFQELKVSAKNLNELL